MAGMLRLKEFQQAVAAGEIDTVVACFPDMQGRLVGKRFQEFTGRKAGKLPRCRGHNA